MTSAVLFAVPSLGQVVNIPQDGELYVARAYRDGETFIARSVELPGLARLSLLRLVAG